MEKKILNEGTKVKMKDTPVVGFASIFGCFEIGDEGIVKEPHEVAKDSNGGRIPANWYKVEFKKGTEIIPDVWFEVVDEPVTTKAEEVAEKESEDNGFELVIRYDGNGFDFECDKDMKEDVTDKEAAILCDLVHALYTMLGLDIDD